MGKLKEHYHKQITQRMSTTYCGHLVFNKILSYLGRNGAFKAKGLMISAFFDIRTVTFEPINSQNNVARARIEFPTEDIPRVIKHLEKIQEKTKAFHEARHETASK